MLTWEGLLCGSDPVQSNKACEWTDFVIILCSILLSLGDLFIQKCQRAAQRLFFRDVRAHTQRTINQPKAQSLPASHSVVPGHGCFKPQSLPDKNTNGRDAESRVDWSSESGGGDRRSSCVVTGKPQERERGELCCETWLWPEEIL